MRFKILAALLPLLFSSSLLAQMHIENAVIRAMPPGQKVTAVYMMISNKTDQNRILVSASSELGLQVEIHENSMDQGVMKMRQVEGVEIPSHGSAILGANGIHLMIFNLQHDLVEGESHMLTLVYDDGSTQEVSTTVTRILPSHVEAGHNHSTMHKVTPTKEETHSYSE